MCQRIVVAMQELEPEYEGKIDFVIVEPADTKARKSELEEYELGSHGLVVLDAEGEPTAHLPGHEFGRDEIVTAITTVLPAG